MGGCFYAGRNNEGVQMVNEILSKQIASENGLGT
jgi:hypothetical protein